MPKLSDTPTASGSAANTSTDESSVTDAVTAASARVSTAGHEVKAPKTDPAIVADIIEDASLIMTRNQPGELSIAQLDKLVGALLDAALTVIAMQVKREAAPVTRKHLTLVAQGGELNSAGVALVAGRKLPRQRTARKAVSA